jgi:hypothetical protein
MNDKKRIEKIKEWIEEQAEDISYEFVQFWPLDRLSFYKKNNLFIQKCLHCLIFSDNYIREKKIPLNVALSFFLKPIKKGNEMVKYQSEKELLKALDPKIFSSALYLFTKNSIAWKELFKNKLYKQVMFFPKNITCLYEELFDGSQYQRTLWLFIKNQNKN